jgi:hypothetical protein
MNILRRENAWRGLIGYLRAQNQDGVASTEETLILDRLVKNPIVDVDSPKTCIMVLPPCALQNATGDCIDKVNMYQLGTCLACIKGVRMEEALGNLKWLHHVELLKRWFSSIEQVMNCRNREVSEGYRRSREIEHSTKPKRDTVYTTRRLQVVTG